MSHAVSNTVIFRNTNTLRLDGGTRMNSFPFGVSGIQAISHNFFVYATEELPSETRAQTRFFGANGRTLSVVTSGHSFAVPAGVFTRVKVEDVPVPSGAKWAQLELMSRTGTVYFGLIKTEAGPIASDFTANFSGQLSRLTATGLYTGTVTAETVIMSNHENLEDRMLTMSDRMISISSSVTNNSNQLTQFDSRLTASELRFNQKIEESNGQIKAEYKSALSAQALIFDQKLDSKESSIKSAYRSELSAQALELEVKIKDTKGDITSAYKSALSAQALSFDQSLSTARSDLTRDYTNKISASEVKLSKQIKSSADPLDKRLTQIEAGKIKLTSQTGGKIANMTISSSTLSATASGKGVRISGDPSHSPFWVGDADLKSNRMFSVNWQGQVVAKDIHAEGSFKVRYAEIAGFIASERTLKATSGNYGIQLSGNPNYSPFWIGDSSFKNPVASFSWDGTLVANKIKAIGQITANSSSTFSGSLNNSTGRHNGTHYGYHNGYQEGNSSGNHTGSLAGTGFSQSPDKSLTFDGRVFASSFRALSRFHESAFHKIEVNGGMDSYGKNNIYGHLNVYARAGESSPYEGSIIANGPITANYVGTRSDRNLKQDIRPVEEDEVDELMKLEIKAFKFKAFPSKLRYGVIAQEVIDNNSKSFADTFVYPVHGWLGFNYSDLIPLLVKKAQDQELRIRELEKFKNAN